MSAPDDCRPAGSSGKVDDDDHNMLTFGEAGERTRIEIAAIRARLADLEAAGNSDAVQKAQSRLGALRAATARNQLRTAQQRQFREYFGYPARPNATFAETDAGEP